MNHKKILLLIVPFISAIAAVLFNLTDPRYLILIMGGLLGFYLVLEMPANFLYIMMACIFLPYSVMIGGVFVASSDFIIALCLGTWLIKSLLLKKPIYLPRFYLFIIVFLLSLIVSIFSAIDMRNSIKEILQYIQLTLCYILVFSNIIKSTKQIKLLLAIGVYCAFILASFAAIYFLMGNVQGVYNLGFHKNALGSLMALSFPIALMHSRTNRSAYNFIVMLTIAGGLGVSLSRGAWLGSAIGILLMEFLYHKKDLAKNLIIVGVCILFAFSVMPTQFKESAVSSHTLSQREEQCNIAKAGFRRSPITGIGYANFLNLSKTFISYHAHDDPHNIALRIAAETGTIGLAAFALLFGAIYYYCFKTIQAEKDPQLRWYEIGLWASLIAY
jgi:O-antigen ligase